MRDSFEQAFRGLENDDDRVEVPTTAEVAATQVRLASEGLATAVEEQTECCYALQDKVWVDGPGGEPWEIYTVLADGPDAAGQLRADDPSGSAWWTSRPERAVPPEAPVVRRLSFLDRWLPVWILVAMALGIGLGRAFPDLNRHLNSVQVTSGTSLPIFVGLLVMMYPVLAKIRYSEVGAVTRDRRMLISSLVLNWIIGPAVMFTLAWLLLPDQPAYRTGLIIVSLARCIAMVLIWNDLSCGDREAAAVLVAINSLFQIVAFSFLGYFYLKVLPGWLGLSTVGLHLSVWRIAQTVLIFFGAPLVAGFLTRTLGERARGREWYETQLLPRLGPFALYGLLFTIVILFALQGHTITTRPAAAARIALPLLAYFAVMWPGAFGLGRALRLPYERTATRPSPAIKRSADR